VEGRVRRERILVEKVSDGKGGAVKGEKEGDRKNDEFHVYLGLFFQEMA
jgi:hypothetical protein